MTKKEYYDLLIKSARDGTFPSFVKLNKERILCAYRSNGHKCAVGILIPDEDYNPLWDGRLGLSYYLLPRDVKDKIRPIGMDDNDITEVQSTHDWFKDVEWDADHFIQKLNSLYCFKEMA